MAPVPEWFLLALVSALFSALAAVGEKKVLFQETAVTFCLLLFMASSLLTTPFLFFIDTDSLSLVGLAVLFGKSILNAVAFLCVMQGIKRLELSNALPFLVLVPGFVAVAAFLFIGDSLTAQQIPGLVLLMAGTWLLETRKTRVPLEPFRVLRRSRGHWYIAAALVLFTATSVLDKVIVVRLEVPPLAFVCFSNLFSLALFIVIFILSPKSSRGLRDCIRSSGRWIALIALCTVIYRYTQITAVQLGPAVALVLAVKRLSVLFATLFGGKLFTESFLRRRTLAVIILLAGALLVTY